MTSLEKRLFRSSAQSKNERASILGMNKIISKVGEGGYKTSLEFIRELNKKEEIPFFWVLLKMSVLPKSKSQKHLKKKNLKR